MIGVHGDLTIHELFVPDDAVMELINNHGSTKQLRSEALKRGMVPLQMDGIEKVKAGIVSIEEILRTAAADAPEDKAGEQEASSA